MKQETSPPTNQMIAPAFAANATNSVVTTIQATSVERKGDGSGVVATTRTVVSSPSSVDGSPQLVATTPAVSNPPETVLAISSTAATSNVAASTAAAAAAAKTTTQPSSSDNPQAPLPGASSSVNQSAVVAVTGPPAAAASPPEQTTALPQPPQSSSITCMMGVLADAAAAASSERTKGAAGGEVAAVGSAEGVAAASGPLKEPLSGEQAAAPPSAAETVVPPASVPEMNQTENATTTAPSVESVEETPFTTPETPSAAEPVVAAPPRTKRRSSFGKKRKKRKASPKKTTPKTTTPSPRRTRAPPPPENIPEIQLYNPKVSTHCTVHKPTLKEIQSHTFSDYVRKFVLPAASVRYETDETTNESSSSSPSAAPTTTSASAAGATAATSAAGTPQQEQQQQRQKQQQPPILQQLSHPMELREGIAKIVLPAGLETNPIVTDRTGRGPTWQAGTELGDYCLQSPIQQHLRGIAGVYEYAFTDQPPTTLAEFRDLADAYRKQQVGCAVEETYHPAAAATAADDEDATAASAENAGAETNTQTVTNENDESQPESEQQEPSQPPPANDSIGATATGSCQPLSEERLQALERLFWKRLGPTMPAAQYGADQSGSLFRPDDAASGWSVAELDSCLHVLHDIPGVTSPYLYAGMWSSVFCAHTEDMNLLSINYLHAGQPKFWYAVAEPDAARFLTLAQFQFAPQAATCREFLRHKRAMLSPAVLKKAGIRYQTAVQYPGEAMITFPASYHFGFNMGFNIAEATNFGVPEWMPFGRQAKVCLCRPLSVRIDMDRLQALLDRYEHDQKGLRRGSRLTWKQWSRKRQEQQRRKEELEREEEEESDEEEDGGPNGSGGPDGQSQEHLSPKKKKAKLSEQQRKKEFWVEVMKPIAGRGRGAVGSIAAAKKQKGKTVVNKKKRQATEKEEEEEEVWHLAKPIGRKGLEVNARVLFMVPGTSLWSAMCQRKKPRRWDALSDEDEEEEEDEQCFSGQVVELADDHVRIHLDGLKKEEDIWMPSSSPKIFLDGGKWNDEHSASMPALHYWQEMDSKRRCVDSK